MDEYPLSEMLEMRNAQISCISDQILDFLYLFLFFSFKCFMDERLHVSMYQ